MSQIARQAWIAVLLFFVTGCAVGPRGFPPAEGIANFRKVNPHLYRGAQPDEAGVRHLREMGIGTIIDLRAPSEAGPDEKKTAASAGMAYHNVPMSGFLRPKTESVRAALAIIEKSPSPVFVHCRYGCDRTGTIIACYRVGHDGWTRGAALDEAKRFGMYPWEVGMKSFVRDFGSRPGAKSRAPSYNEGRVPGPRLPSRPEPK